MATIKAYLDNRKKSKTGMYKIRICVRSKNTVGYIPTNILIKEKNWHEGRIVGTTQDKQLNKLLDLTLSSLKLKLASIGATHDIKMMTGKEIVALIAPNSSEKKKKVQDKTLVAAYWSKFIDRKDKPKTAEVYKTTLSMLGKYCDVDNLRFADITYTWLRDWEAWMEQRGNAVNTRSIYLRNLRAVYNEAIREGLISQENYPFRQFRIKTEQTAKRSLNVDELRRLRDYSGEAHIRKYIDVFFISFYLAGINMIDLLQLPKLEGGRIEYRRSKTGILCQLNVPQEALQLIKKYEGKERMLRFGEEYKNHKDFLHRMNENLQKVGIMFYEYKQAKNGAIHKSKHYIPDFPEITSYWARHTWATIAADIDIPDAVIDMALGHKSPYPMTDIYIRRNQKKVDEAVMAVIEYVNSDR
jgi:integrase|nr:MAG TPA: Integrase [Caudoviricetes sp.]